MPYNIFSILILNSFLEENYRAGMEAGGYFRSCRLFKKYLRGRFNFF